MTVRLLSRLVVPLISLMGLVDVTRHLTRTPRCLDGIEHCSHNSVDHDQHFLQAPAGANALGLLWISSKGLWYVINVNGFPYITGKTPPPRGRRVASFVLCWCRLAFFLLNLQCME